MVPKLSRRAIRVAPFLSHFRGPSSVRIWRSFVAVVTLIALLAQGAGVLAGTTGGIDGQLLETGTKSPIAGAKVTVASPSQTASTTTDSSGHFVFISLAPDTYTVSIEKQGYESVLLSGVNVIADHTQTLSPATGKQLQTIGRVAARGAASLVKPGITTDVYSVTPTQQTAAQGLGGGGSINAAYSAVASQPGVFVPQGQNGIYQSVYIRGGNYTNIGYEFDGVPIQRAFDQYPTNTLSSLGNAEVQVYTGANPIGSQTNGLAGFINQVIQTGTTPGFTKFEYGLGSPTGYQKLQLETGGATTNKNFSYYVGLAGYNQDFRYADQFNGAPLDAFYGSQYNYIASGCGTPSATVGCYKNTGNTGGFPPGPFGPNGWAQGPFNALSALTSQLEDREAIVNLHFAIPHHHDAGKDDIQVLYNNSWLRTFFPDSFNDWTYSANNVLNGTANYGGPFAANSGTFYPNCGGPYSGTACAVLGGAPPVYDYDQGIYTGPLGRFLTPANLSQTQAYYSPNSPTNRLLGGLIPSYTQDTYDNRASIFKLQYQKNFSSSAYLRVYGYTSYSDWLQNGQTSLTQNFVGGVSPDYELPTHTRGVALDFGDQLNAQNLLNVSAGYDYANATRWNNTTYNGTFTGGTPAAVLVNSANPTNGICYSTTGGAPTPVYCGSPAVASYLTPGAVGPPVLSLQPGHGGADPTLAAAGSLSCGGAPCAYYTVDSGISGTYNTVSPRFTNWAVEDQWKPIRNLQLNLGLHYDDFRYDLSSTDAASGPLPTGGSTSARTLFTNSYNTFHCFNPAQPSLGVLVLPSTVAPGTGACATAYGTGFGNTAFSDTSASTADYHLYEPRFGLTYTVNPYDVIRASYGKFAQPPSSAYEQYNVAQANIAAYDAPKFYGLGFTDPSHPVAPEVSYNLDFSWEHQVKGTDMSWKLTPFLRKTQGSIYNVLLDPKTSFVSGINIGDLTAEGLELLFRKGDFDRNGFAAQLAYTYTWGQIKYNALPNGLSVVDQLNQQVRTYNAYTSYCASHAGSNLCSVGGAAPTDPTTGSPVVGAPCYTTSGAAAPGCGAGTVANPYWNAPVQGLFDPNASYVAYNQLPGAGPGPGATSVGDSYIIPHVATLIMNYKHNKFAITPSLQFFAGGRYGLPNANVGVDPATCGGVLATGLAGDPRYGYGAPGGAPYDAQTCTGAITAPDSFSGHFDNFGQYLEPSQLVGNIQLSFEATKNVTFRLTAVNVFNRCFGGTKAPWTNIPGDPGTVGCWYNSNGDALPTGNFYNPGNVLQPLGYTYTPAFGNTFQTQYGSQANPFELFLTADIKL